MFQVQLKRIETAMNSGRLDEAFELLIATPQREHRDGQHLTDQLVDQLLSRGDRHLASDRIDDAEADVDKAMQLAGRCDAVAELVQKVRRLRERHNAARSVEREATAAARMQSDLGQFTLGQNLLLSGFDHSKLNAEIQRNRSLAADAASRVEAAVQSNDLIGGARFLGSLNDSIRRHRLVAEQSNILVRMMLDSARSEFRGGRLDRSVSLLNLLAPIANDQTEFSELKSALDRCVVALDLARASQYHDAERELAIVGQILGDCQWILNSRQSLAELHRLDASLLSGPLGLLDQVASTIAQPVVNQQTPLSLDKRFGRSDDHLHASGRIDHLLTVDGVGAILLIQSNTVSIGCVSKSNQHDIPLQTQGPSSPVMIRRTGDDYFAESEIEFRVNDHPTLRRLLVAGDSIGFGRRGRLRFRKPVPASGSAVLQLTGAGLSRQDIRHVALMADSLLFSNGGGHFSVANCERPIVVFSQPGGYAIKYAGSGGEVGKLELGQSQLLGQTRFTLNQINLSNSSGEK